MSAMVAFFQSHFSAECATFLISMLPIIEFRGGIPFGIAMGVS